LQDDFVVNQHMPRGRTYQLGLCHELPSKVDLGLTACKDKAADHTRSGHLREVWSFYGQCSFTPDTL